MAREPHVARRHVLCGTSRGIATSQICSEVMFNLSGCLHDFVRLVANESTQFDVGHFMWNLHSLTNFNWHYKLISRLAGIFGFLSITLLLNKFAHPALVRWLGQRGLKGKFPTTLAWYDYYSYQYHACMR